MWKIRKLMETDRIVLSISGRIEAQELLEVQKAVSAEGTASKGIDLDLENVRLVDQEVVTYLACCEASGTRLRNCPAYIREWIEREKGGLYLSGNGDKPPKSS